MVYNDQITLEYYLPKDVATQGVISISQIVHGYRYINVTENTKDDPLRCQVDINCSEGLQWQREKNAVARILISGGRWCTGALINNTANDDTPYFLTADHCLSGHDAERDPYMDDYIFYWNYESPDCNNPTIVLPTCSTTRATVVANAIRSDFALLLLEDDPKDHPDILPYYLGWDASGSPGPAAGGVGIHHPMGSVKKISTYSTLPRDSR